MEFSEINLGTLYLTLSHSRRTTLFDPSWQIYNFSHHLHILIRCPPIFIEYGTSESGYGNLPQTIEMLISFYEPSYTFQFYLIMEQSGFFDIHALLLRHKK